MGGDEGARRLEQFRIRAKDFNVDTDGRDDDRLDGARDVTHGHVTNGSARGQEDCVDAVSFEYLRLRVAHYFTRNRTDGSDFPPFFSAHDRSRPSFAVAFVYVSGNGKGVCLVMARVRFPRSAPLFC